MDRMKTFRKYFLWFIGLYLFSMIFIYVGLNASYKNINGVVENNKAIKVNLNQATLVNGRILGEVTSTEENNLNGKFLKVDIFSKKDELIGTKYLKIQDLKNNESKKFAVYFSAKGVDHYTIDLVDSSEEIEKESVRARDLYKDIFISEDLKFYSIVGLILYAMI